MKKSKIIVLILLLVVFAYWAVSYVQRRTADPFQTYIQKLERRNSITDIMSAQSGIISLGTNVVPRLVDELEIITNTLSQEEIYNLCLHGYSGNGVNHDARPTLARENIYGLISTLDAKTYQQMVIKSCRSNDLELCLILKGANSEKLLLLPKEQLFELTNALSEALKVSNTNSPNRTCIEDFFNRLEFQQSQSGFLNVPLETQPKKSSPKL